MIWLFLNMFFALVAASVLGIIALVRRIRKKTYKTQLRIAKICVGVGAVSLVAAASNGEGSMIALLSAILLIVYGVYESIVWIVRKIAKRKTKAAMLKTLLSLGTGLSVTVIGIGGNLAAVLNLFAVMLFAAMVVLLIVNVIRAICRRKNLFMWLSVPACLVLGIVLMVVANHSWDRQLAQRTATGEIYEEPIQITYDFEVVDGEEPIEIVTHKIHDLNRDSVYVYDEKDLHLVFEDDFATAEECIEAIRANDKIEQKFKDFFIDFVERMDKTYPGLNYAILYHNLQTLDVQELSSTEYMFESLSVTSLGCYNKRKNTIFIPEGTEYVEGEFGFQVLVHEFCHAARSGWYSTEEQDSTIEFYDSSDNLILMEAMNSVFSCSLLNYYEWDIAYQVPSNYLRIMLECMDNYSLEDYFKHRDTYFLSKLDEFTGHTNYAQVIWKLIALQRSDWEDDKVDIPAEEYYPLFDYLCSMYYGKYITDDMSVEEKTAVADELVHKAFYDAPENYKIDTDYFYEYLGLTAEAA